MVRTAEIQDTKTTIEFMLPLTNGIKTERPARAVTIADQPIGVSALETNGIILSGTQVLWSCLSALSFVGVFLWAILKLWLHE